MTYGLYLKDDQNKLIIDGSKLFTSWCNTMSDNCDGSSPALLHFKLPDQIISASNIIYFMFSIRWLGYRLHNTFTSSSDLTIGTAGNHVHSVSGTTSANSTGALSQVTGSSTTNTTASDFGSTSYHEHTYTDVYHTQPNHAHTINININLAAGEHIHAIGQHQHSVSPYIYDFPVPTSSTFSLALNNSNIFTAMPITSYSLYRTVDIVNYSLLSINNFNTIAISLSPSSSYGKVEVLYYIQCYMEY